MKTIDFAQAAIEAARQGEYVLYQAAGWNAVRERFNEIRSIIESDGGELPSKVYLSMGDQRILFPNGGKIVFQGREPRGFHADLHVLDGIPKSYWSPVADRFLGE